MQQIYTQIKPDTLSFWESLFNVSSLIRKRTRKFRGDYSLSPQEQLSDRDSRRIGPLVGWILALPLEFHSDSAFSSKSLLNSTEPLVLIFLLLSSEQELDAVQHRGGNGLATIRSTRRSIRKHVFGKR